ncbi:hypothetical protein V2J09_018859 [Rumex salicifolius]
MEKKGVGKRYALLQAVRDSEYVKHKYGGYLNVFVSAFGEEGETWDLYRVVDCQFPRFRDLSKYDGFVITGSPHDAYSDDYWILKLSFLIRILDAMHKKILGICFGHQILCRALGGKVGKAYSGWDIGLREVKIRKDLLPTNAFVDGIIPSSLSIMKIHQDEVWEVPSEAEVIAHSEKTGVEMFTIEDHIMGIQGHPEYTKDILCNLIDRLLHSNTIEVEFADKARSSLEVAEPDRMYWEKICRSFLKK